MQKITKQDAVHHGREGVDGYYYQLPNIENGTTFAYAEFTGEHGQRTIGDRPRIYYILEGKAKFEVNGENFEASATDLVPIPAGATYNLWPINGTLKIILVMDLIDFGENK